MKRKIKFLIFFTLAVFMAIVLAACSSGGTGASQSTSPEPSPNEGQTVEAGQDEAEPAQAADTAAEPAQAADTAASQTAETAAAAATAEAAESAEAINYLALVNKLNPLPDGWEDALETVHMTNSIGDDVEVEKKAYDAYLKLKEDLEKVYK